MKFLKNRTVLGIVCIALALIICFAITPLFNAAKSHTMKIIRIKSNVKIGQEITSGDVESVEVGAYNMPSDVLQKTDDVVGKYAAMDMVKGEYVLPTKISDTPANENAYLYNLTGEKRAISITIPSFAGGLSGNEYAKVFMENADRYTVLYNRFRKVMTKSGQGGLSFILKRYGRSEMLRYICETPICPIGYVQTNNPMYKKKKICKYTAEGREEIHRNLKFDETVMTVLHILARVYLPNRSVEYMDNRVSLYAAQYGKCAVTGKALWIDEIHCHHKKPISQGGTDEYKNLIIIHTDVHKLIHATKAETIQAYLDKIKPNKSQLEKINKLRVLAGNPAI